MRLVRRSLWIATAPVAGASAVAAAPCPDVDLDGYADRSNTVLHYGGRAVVFSVSAERNCTVLRVLSDPELAIYSYLGYAVSALPDVTGDGVADIAVGESGYANNTGCVLVFSGSDGALVRRIVGPAGALNDHLGESLATIQCLDGDGVDDIVAGAYHADTPGGVDAGKAVVFSGADGAKIQELTDPNGLAGDGQGYAVASDYADLTAEDPESPGVGVTFYYLVRAQNGCGEGTLGSDGGGDPRPGRGCP